MHNNSSLHLMTTFVAPFQTIAAQTIILPPNLITLKIYFLIYLFFDSFCNTYIVVHACPVLQTHLLNCFHILFFFPSLFSCFSLKSTQHSSRFHRTGLIQQILFKIYSDLCMIAFLKEPEVVSSQHLCTKKLFSGNKNCYLYFLYLNNPHIPVIILTRLIILIFLILFSFIYDL